MATPAGFVDPPRRVRNETPLIRLHCWIYRRPCLPSGDADLPSRRGVHPPHSLPHSVHPAIWNSPNLVPGFLGRGLGADFRGLFSFSRKGRKILVGCNPVRCPWSDARELVSCSPSQRPASGRRLEAGAHDDRPPGERVLGFGNRPFFALGFWKINAPLRGFAHFCNVSTSLA